MRSSVCVPPATCSGAGVDKPTLKLVVAGHVDHGKSTLVGRLLHDTGSFPEGYVEALRAASARRGMSFEWSFALDALQVERDQAVTVETTRRWLHMQGHDVLLIDAPGHREFIAKMITGAAVANAALLIVDVADGVQEQTRRHAHLLGLLGITRLIVAVNKMDLVGCDQARFETRRIEIDETLEVIGLTPMAVIPVIATDGGNLVRPSPHMSWYKGPTVVDILTVLAPAAQSSDHPLRLPLQDVYRVGQRRLYAGRIESGHLNVGDEILFSPSNKTAKVSGIEIWPQSLKEAVAGQSIGITIDRPLFVERGEVISHILEPPLLNRQFSAVVVWLGNQPLKAGQSYRMQLGTVEATVVVKAVERVVDTDDAVMRAAHELNHDEIGEIVVQTPRLLALDDSAHLSRTARFVLRDRCDVVAGGLTRLAALADLRPAPSSYFITPVTHRVTRELRTKRFGHGSGVLWFTGLSGAGKSTLAMAVEDNLFRKGYTSYVLDGDNIRGGLNADLGFQPRDRAENNRRVAEVAALFADAGFVCITAFISPFAVDRARARAVIGVGFHEIYIQADLATCERRDPRGLYRRARAGEIQEFTGISSAYEPPEIPDLVVDTANQSVEVSVEQIVRYIETNLRPTDQD